MDARPVGVRVGRPGTAEPCATCGELVGRGYPVCPDCVAAVDERWRSDWAELVTPDPAEVADAPPGVYRWTCVDWALRQLRCAGCGGELAAGSPDCVGCAAADSARWELPGVAPGERALRVAVVALRAPDWHRAAIVSTYRLVLPFVLAGWRPDRATLSLIKTLVLAGRYDELAALGMPPLELPALPWRFRSASS